MRYVKDDKRKQRHIEKLFRKMAKAPHVAVGILQDDPVADGFSMVDLATVHEYGSKNGHIPQRSFIRSTCDAKRKEHVVLIDRLHSKMLSGVLTIKQALAQLGGGRKRHRANYQPRHRSQAESCDDYTQKKLQAI